MSRSESRRDLVALLRLAYSGERAACYAYQGHARSVSDPTERDAIRKIEDEEWHHRRLVGEMLASLGAAPDRVREVRALVLGKLLGFLCLLSGWLIPMYGAGKLESRNVREYETAARHALGCGRHDLIDCLLTMAEVEWEHERHFRERVLGHRLGARLPIWPAPPPKETIRGTFPFPDAGLVAAQGS